MKTVPSLNVGETVSALCDLASLVDGMIFAHGSNQMADSIMGAHKATIYNARRWAFAKCPVCADSACEVKSMECGK